MADLLDTLRTDGGFTYDPRGDHLVSIGGEAGYAIAVPGTERVVGSGKITRATFADAFVVIVREYGALLDHDAYIGGWYSQDRDAYLVEVSELWPIDRDSAVALGCARNQEAILDLATGEFIGTGGTGG